MGNVCANCLALGLAVGPVGCALTGPASNPYATLQQHQARDTYAAQHHNDKGLEAIQKQDYTAAEAAFRAALEADVFYPAAHNNLGLALLEQGRIYESAWEFQYAAKLMPKSAQPRHNLGTLMERVGHLDEAEKFYSEALSIEPENVEIMGHLARVYLKADRRDETVRELLRKLALRADRGTWDRWARQWLIRLEE